MKCVEAKSIEGFETVLQSFYDTHQSGRFGLDVRIEDVADELEVLINGTMTTVFILVSEKMIAGFIGVVLFKSPTGKDIIANEKFWYVMPEYRGYSLKLFRKAKSWAKDHGASHFISNASMLASNLHDKICKIYEAFGMEKFETSYIKKLR